MEREKLDFQHAVLLGSLKGTLTGPGQACCQAASQVLEWAGNSMGANFSAHHKIKDEHAIGEALLHRDAKYFNPPFMTQWIERFGIGSLFPESSGTGLVSAWIEKIRKDLSSSYSTSAQNQAPLLTWLLERAPAHAVPLDPLPALADQIEKQRKQTGLDPAFEKLLVQVSRHAQSMIDPHRPPLRWLPASVALVQDVDLLAPALCPSGTIRSLGDLARMRSIPEYNPSRSPGPNKPHPGSPSTIPNLPHGRKLELARNWILDPAIDLDVARARAWACCREKPEAIAQMLYWATTPPRGRDDMPDRIKDILLARDAFGRGIMAWLACSHNAEASVLSSGIARRLGLDPQQVSSPDGAGLVEQIMTGRRIGHADDAFHGSGVAKWAMDSLPPAQIAGPADRQDQIISDLVDTILPFSIQLDLAKTMQQAAPDPRLSTALAWSGFFRAIANPPRSSTNQGSRAASNQSAYVAKHVQSLHSKVDRLLLEVSSNMGALDIGMVEWRQWGPMLLEGAQKYDIDSRFTSALNKLLPDIERVVQANDMHRRAPAASACRPSPRL